MKNLHVIGILNWGLPQYLIFERTFKLFLTAFKEMNLTLQLAYMCLCLSLAFLKTSLRFCYVFYSILFCSIQLKDIGWNSLNWFYDPNCLKNPVLEFYSPGISFFLSFFCSLLSSFSLFLFLSLSLSLYLSLPLFFSLSLKIPFSFSSF